MSKRNNRIEITDNGIDGGSEFVDPAVALNDDRGNDSIGSERDSAGNEFDPAIHSHPDRRNSDGSFRRKRGRRKGSKSRASIHSDIKASAEMLTKGLMIFHTSLAAITRTPELMLVEEEANGLAVTGLTLLELYDIKPDPKVEAAIMFAGQIGLVYGTRIVAIRARKSQEAKEKKPGVAGVYTPDGATAGTTEWRTEWPLGEQSEPNTRVN